jgi:ADP-ribose pyrophosphatase YjhB (NUDIX family)
MFAVLLSRDRDRHLVLRGRDTSKTPEHFHRLLGGHLEFGETLAAGVVRESREELDVELREPHLLGTVESIFSFEGQPGHEIVFVFDGHLGEGEADPVPAGGAWRDDGGPIWVEWRPVDPALADIPLYPEGVQAMVEKAVARRA